jgi:hypothetical protein
MVAMVVEVMLIAVGVLPLVATTPRAARALNRSNSDPLSTRRGN